MFKVDYHAKTHLKHADLQKINLKQNKTKKGNYTSSMLRRQRDSLSAHLIEVCPLGRL